MRSRWWTLLFGSVLTSALTTAAANAMQFIAHEMNDRQFVIEGLGTMINGDVGRLRSAIESTAARGAVVGLTLNSPGGLLREAGSMADLIRIKNLRVIVLEGSRCLSACFVLFAAGRDRVVYPNAWVGVHSASEIGSEDTTNSRSMTDTMAKLAARYGVPGAIIDKMVRTGPNDMELLTRADFELMGVTILDKSGVPMAPSSPKP